MFSQSVVESRNAKLLLPSCKSPRRFKLRCEPAYLMANDDFLHQEAERTSIKRDMDALTANSAKLSEDLQARAMEIDNVQARV